MKSDFPLIGLLDTNVLVALFDPAHTHHETAHTWLSDGCESGWASCAVTENGLVRVLSNPSYPGSTTTAADAAQRLRLFRDSGNHYFLASDVSIAEESTFRWRYIQGHRQITDTYLLALAAAHHARLVTFDTKIKVDAVATATEENLHLISP